MMMETRNLASGALFWNCKYVSVLVCVCVFFGWMCLHIVVYERLSANFRKQKKKERERESFYRALARKFAALILWLQAQQFHHLTCFSLLLLFRTAFSLRLFLRSVDLNVVCAFHFSSSISFFPSQFTVAFKSCHNSYSCEFTLQI